METESSDPVVTPCEPRTFLLAIDIEKADRRAGSEGVVGVGVACSIDGEVVEARAFWMPLVISMVDPLLKAEFLDQPYNKGVLEDWLTFSQKAFTIIAHDPEDGSRFPTHGDLDRPSIEHEVDRLVARKIQCERLAGFIDNFQLQVRPGVDKFRIITDFSEFDVALTSDLVHPIRGADLAHIARRKEGEDEVTYSWHDAALNVDSLYRMFLPADVEWGYGKKLCEQWGLEPVTNPHPHDPASDAVTILREYLVLAPEMERRVKAMVI